MRQSLRETGNHRAAHIEVFRYPAAAEPPAPSWEAWGGLEGAAESFEECIAGSGDDAGCVAAEHGSPARDARLAEEARRDFEAGRERGFQEGQAAEREAQAAHNRAQERGRAEHAARLTENFHAEQARYFEAVEQEVVKLALAVAARILRREAQMDPLLLTGAVRVALGQLAATTQVRLRVPGDELELWTETIAHLPNLAVKPAVIAGEGMRLGECTLETELGSVDLGVRAQLGEIERGFFDGARRSPGTHVEQPHSVAGEVHR